jgi:dTDP-4-amino-4,6-dideoxygalactose transaminase
MKKLAIHGGPPVRSKPFPEYRTIGQEEKRAVSEVLDSGILSGFLGSWTPEFYGGPRVRQLEREWSEYFGAKYAITVNSATSGLNAAVGASGVGPGDEVIVSPYTMSASAACVLVYNAIPVFADIDPETFCLSPESIRKCLTPRTKAIVIVDLFGHPFDRDEVMALAQENNLVVIEDAAQAPGALYHGRYAGTLAHIGVFSLNCHKTIHTGEGGVIVTDDDRFAERLQLIRNHAEVVVREKRVKHLVNMLGFNYRMTEIEAAIGSEQLKKLDDLLKARIDAASYLTERMHDLPGLTPPVVRPGLRHGYYVYAIRYDARKTGIPRDRFVKALNAEGIPMTAGYVEPIYLQPLYQERILYGTEGCPFSCAAAKTNVQYGRGICPVTERMYDEELMLTNICHADITRPDMEDALAGIEKVLDHAGEFDGVDPQPAVRL